MQAVAWYTLFLTMDEHEPTQPFFLIVIDEDRGVFSVEGPMTDGRPWQSAARKARKTHVTSFAARPGQSVIRSPQCSAASVSWLVFHRVVSPDLSVDAMKLNADKAKKDRPSEPGRRVMDAARWKGPGGFAQCLMRPLIGVAIPSVWLLYRHHSVRDTDCSYG